MMFKPSPRPRRRRAWRWWLAGGAAALVALSIVSRPKTPAPVAAPPIPTPTYVGQTAVSKPLVFTYLFYWYDAKSNYHLGPKQPLPVHPVASPQPSWTNVAWFKKELTDMSAAGIDVALPVYWGFDHEAWSRDGLATLATAHRQLTAAGARVPSIGMFLDTSILSGRDLTDPANMAYVYANVKDFFTRIPSSEWARVDSRPVVWLWWPQPGNNFNQDFFNYLYDHFTRDFGAHPFIVRETGWYCAITGWIGAEPQRDCSQPIKTDADYVWGVAYSGYHVEGSVAAVGPGYDERQIPGRSGKLRPRDNGAWYRANFDKAIASHKRLLAIETWNEFHEATGISDSVEYGRSYIDLTRTLVDRFRQSLGAGH